MNVFDAANSRLDFVFKNFDNIYVSFSGGKDSGVLLEMALQKSKEHKKRIGVFHIDYEAQYEYTTEYVKNMFDRIKDSVDLYHICLPIAAQCATSSFQSYWLPWEKSKKDIWTREMPETAIHEDNCELDFFEQGMWDYEFQEKFIHWLHDKNKAKKTACLVGIRTAESMNRWRAIHSDRNENKHKGKIWSTEMDDSHKKVNFYPLFDWSVDDIWIANKKQSWDYNKLYDLFYMAGVPIAKMRVASPFNDCAMESLKLYKVIDPKNWGKMIGRVSGVNFAGLYGGTTAMGWKSIKLPKGHTWKSYMEFLLSTLPKEASDNYKKKLRISQYFWQKKGGVLSKEVIKKLKKSKVKFKIGKDTNYKTNKMPVMMSYLDDIDIDEFQAIPTYKRMCVCIMKNDHLCKYMGFSLTKTEMQMRKQAERKYENIKVQKSGL